ncbi:metallophosphoesterase [Micromonospora sp. NBC_01655]|uniref:metallophosphoesterase family protein n=1 Tax=Micromonospora sp. NBC_01655 TaxID=2975983 RepID=UPI00224D085B|nr:metallophosphoesterase [Micromonospora sp. NBC_01655]MCX4469262.1 metallophosphoesterase [Micromonospora sp. NBC_01655]
MARGRPADAGRARVLVVGDVHGEFELLAGWSAAVGEALGPLDAILAVGDVEPNRDETDAAGVHGPAKYRRVGDFPLLVEGLLDLGAPLHFIGGNHEPWPALDAAGPGRWSEGVHFLGRAGVTEVAGLRVAFLSGIHSPRITDVPRARRDTARERTYYTAEEVHQVSRAARRAGAVDVLLTHDWPAGLTGPRRNGPVGRAELRTLCERLRPRWHFCGHMHDRHRGAIGPTEIVCLGHIRSGPQAFAVIEREPDGRLVLVEDVTGAARNPIRPDHLTP